MKNKLEITDTNNSKNILKEFDSYNDLKAYLISLFDAKDKNGTLISNQNNNVIIRLKKGIDTFCVYPYNCLIDSSTAYVEKLSGYGELQISITYK
jgi:hypothetical protein